MEKPVFYHSNRPGVRKASNEQRNYEDRITRGGAGRGRRRVAGYLALVCWYACHRTRHRPGNQLDLDQPPVRQDGHDTAGLERGRERRRAGGDAGPDAQDREKPDLPGARGKRYRRVTARLCRGPARHHAAGTGG